MTSKLLTSTLILASSFGAAYAQQAEGLVPTQALVRPDSKNDTLIPTLDTTQLELNGKSATLSSLTRVQPSGVQIALLIDDGLRRSAGIQLEDIKKFISTLPIGTEILVGYMSNGRVEVLAPFTTDHAQAASVVRLPIGVAGISASPYFCLSDFVKHWPGNDERAEVTATTGGKARFALMITDGVDLYNGSTSILNQDSPYVLNSISDAQRAGVVVSSIYYGDAGIRGGRANFSGQSYLQQVASATGGEAYYQGIGNPVSLSPFFKQFDHDISETYVATFGADATHEGRDQLLRVKLNSSIPKLKFRKPDEVRPGNHETGAPASTNASAL